MSRSATSLAVVFFFIGRCVDSDLRAAPSADESDIRKTVAEYVRVFNQRDSSALAELWTPDAVYTNRSTGEQAVGRKAIAGQFAALFKAQPDLKLDVSTESIQFVSPSVAVEHGTARFLQPKQDPETVQYTAIYVKQGGRWLLDRVTDEEQAAIRSHYERLKTLEWMVGQWAAASEAAHVELECNWTKNRNYLTRSFKITVGDQVHLAGMQIIGWDPSAKTIRSWTFDSNGGFAEATWTHKKDTWFIQNKGILADGRKASLVNVMKQVDDDSFTWRTVERTAGGELLPDIGEVLIVRQ